jgi:hypothetical protein
MLIAAAPPLVLPPDGSRRKPAMGFFVPNRCGTETDKGDLRLATPL